RGTHKITSKRGSTHGTHGTGCRGKAHVSGGVRCAGFERLQGRAGFLATGVGGGGSLDWGASRQRPGAGGYRQLVEAVPRRDARWLDRHRVPQQPLPAGGRGTHPAGAGTAQCRSRRVVSATAGARRGGAASASEPGGTPVAWVEPGPRDE